MYLGAVKCSRNLQARISVRKTNCLDQRSYDSVMHVHAVQVWASTGVELPELVSVSVS